MGGARGTESPRRAQLVLLNASERFVAPPARIVVRPRRRFTWPPEAAGTQRADGHVLVELGTRLSYLVPRAHAGRDGTTARVHHRMRAPASGTPCIALEPFRYLQRHLLGVAVLGDLDAEVGAEPLVDLAVLVVGDTFTVAGVSFGFTTYQNPVVVDITESTPARRCALCRGPLRPGDRAVRCRCSAHLHAGATPPYIDLDAHHRCADVGPCPDCGADLPRVEGHDWLPVDEPRSPRPRMPRHLRSSAHELELAQSPAPRLA